MTQVNKWDIWLEENFSALRPIFEKSLGVKETVLSREFSVFDKTKIYFAVLAGRRHNFNELTRRLKRNDLKKNIELFHYDNLLDSCRMAIGSATY